MAGWGWKKKKQWGTRYLHVSMNATQNGLTSWGVKVGPISWNSRLRGFRFDGPGGLYYDRRPKRDGNRQQRRAAGDKPTAGRGRKRRGAAGAVAAWGVTWVARGARWSAVQAGQRSSGYAAAVSAPGAAALERRRRFGRGTPVVEDMTTGTEHRATDALLPDPVYGDEAVSAAAESAWADQVRRDEEARTEHAMRTRPLSAWERWRMRMGGQDPDAWEETSRAIDDAVLARRADRLRQEQLDRQEAADAVRAAAESGVTPDPALVASAAATKETDMANPVRNMADLRDPAIDPDEYQDELPAHIGDAAKLVGSIADGHRANVEALRGEAEALRSYAEYMETAEVDRSVLSPITEAADALDEAAAGAARVAEQWETAEAALSSAHRAADAVYGEHRPPKFRKAG